MTQASTLDSILHLVMFMFIFLLSSNNTLNQQRKYRHPHASANVMFNVVDVLVSQYSRHPAHQTTENATFTFQAEQRRAALCLLSHPRLFFQCPRWTLTDGWSAPSRHSKAMRPLFPAFSDTSALPDISAISNSSCDRVSRHLLFRGQPHLQSNADSCGCALYCCLETSVGLPPVRPVVKDG